MKLIQALLRRADRYAAQSTWRDFALVKLCLCAMGILLGLTVPRRKRRPTALAAGAVFLATYVALLGRVLPVMLAKEPQAAGAEEAPQAEVGAGESAGPEDWDEAGEEEPQGDEA